MGSLKQGDYGCLFWEISLIRFCFCLLSHCFLGSFPLPLDLLYYSTDFFFSYSSFMFVILFYFQSKRFSYSTFLSFRCSLLLAHFISKTWFAVITFNFCVMEIAPLMSKMIEFILWSFCSLQFYFLTCSFDP